MAVRVSSRPLPCQQGLPGLLWFSLPSLPPSFPCSSYLLQEVISNTAEFSPCHAPPGYPRSHHCPEVNSCHTPVYLNSLTVSITRIVLHLLMLAQMAPGLLWAHSTIARCSQLSSGRNSQSLSSPGPPLCDDPHCTWCTVSLHPRGGGCTGPQPCHHPGRLKTCDASPRRFWRATWASEVLKAPAGDSNVHQGSDHTPSTLPLKCGPLAEEPQLELGAN